MVCVPAVIAVPSLLFCYGSHLYNSPNLDVASHVAELTLALRHHYSQALAHTETLCQSRKRIVLLKVPGTTARKIAFSHPLYGRFDPEKITRRKKIL